MSVKTVTPSLASATNFKDGVKLEWESVPGAAKYRLYRKDRNSNDKLLPLADTVSSETTFLDTTALAGRTYVYSMKPLDSTGNEMYGSFDWEGKTVSCEYTEVESDGSSSSGDSSGSDSGGFTPITSSPDNSSSDDPLDVQVVKNTMRISSVKVKVNGKKIVKISGKVSAQNANVKIKVGNKKYKKARVAGNKFILKLSSKVKNNVRVTIKATKAGYKTVTKTTIVAIR